MHFCKSFNPLLKCCDVLDMSKNHHIGLFYKLFIFCNVWTVCVHHVWSFAKFPYLKKVFEVVRFFISFGFTRAVLNNSKKNESFNNIIFARQVSIYLLKMPTYIYMKVLFFINCTLEIRLSIMKWFKICHIFVITQTKGFFPFHANFPFFSREIPDGVSINQGIHSREILNLDFFDTRT